MRRSLKPGRVERNPGGWLRAELPATAITIVMVFVMGCRHQEPEPSAREGIQESSAPLGEPGSADGASAPKLRSEAATSNLINREVGGASAAPSATTPQVPLTDIVQADLTSRLSPEQAQQLRLKFDQLAAEGRGAIPAIREMLEKGQNLSFGKEATKLGIPSLRTGLLDALRQIGGPDAVEASADVLRTTKDPVEIAQLARTLAESGSG